MTLEASSLFSLEGRTALLTGASGYLGRTFARALLVNGARLIALGRSERLDDLAAEWSREFGVDRVRPCRVDMYDIPAFSAVLDEIATQEAVAWGGFQSPTSRAKSHWRSRSASAPRISARAPISSQSRRDHVSVAPRATSLSSKPISYARLSTSRAWPA